MPFQLTHTEWAVLECLWEQSPMTLMQLVEQLKHTTGWAKSTTTTMVRRMEEKGYIRSEQNGRGKNFFPNIDRDEAVATETKSFLNRVYHGSIGMMMSAMTQRQELSQEEIDALYAILQEAEAKRK